MKLKALIKRLDIDKDEYHDQDVEFIIVRKSDGAIITMEMETKAGIVIRALKRGLMGVVS